jgi:hypothetical protein
VLPDSLVSAQATRLTASPIIVILFGLARLLIGIPLATNLLGITVKQAAGGRLSVRYCHLVGAAFAIFGAISLRPHPPLGQDRIKGYCVAGDHRTCSIRDRCRPARSPLTDPGRVPCVWSVRVKRVWSTGANVT